MKTVYSVYSLLMNSINLSHSTQVDEETVFRIHTIAQLLRSVHPPFPFLKFSGSCHSVFFFYEEKNSIWFRVSDQSKTLKRNLDHVSFAHISTLTTNLLTCSWRFFFRILTLLDDFHFRKTLVDLKNIWSKEMETKIMAL